jgi:hypothetical protein
MLREIRGLWAKRKKRTQEKYAEHHAWVDPAELEPAKKNFEYRTPRQPRH